MSILQAVQARRGIEFNSSVEGIHILLVDGGAHLVCVQRACCFDGFLQDEAGGIAARTVIRGFLLTILGAVKFQKGLDVGAEPFNLFGLGRLRTVLGGGLPLRCAGNTNARFAQFAELGSGGATSNAIILVLTFFS